MGTTTVSKAWQSYCHNLKKGQLSKISNKRFFKDHNSKFFRIGFGRFKQYTLSINFAIHWIWSFTNLATLTKKMVIVALAHFFPLNFGYYWNLKKTNSDIIPPKLPMVTNAFRILEMKVYFFILSIVMTDSRFRNICVISYIAFILLE